MSADDASQSDRFSRQCCKEESESHRDRDGRNGASGSCQSFVCWPKGQLLDRSARRWSCGKRETDRRKRCIATDKVPANAPLNSRTAAATADLAASDQIQSHRNRKDDEQAAANQTRKRQPRTEEER